MKVSRRLAWSVAVVALLALAGIVATRALHPNRVVIVNHSGAEIHQVVLTLTPLDKSRPVVRSCAVVKPGESEILAHAFNDFAAVLEFADANGRSRRYETPHIDLWTGEGWVFTIHAGGVVEEGYDYPGELRR